MKYYEKDISDANLRNANQVKILVKVYSGNPG